MSKYFFLLRQAPVLFLSLLFLPFLTSQARPSSVSYERFGAVGDGVHDDQAAIVKAHAFANSRNLPVRATPGKTYYIGGGSEVAVIMTDVDFTGARFLIDDTACSNYKKPVFFVRSRSASHAVEGVASLRAGQHELGVTLPARSLLVVEDNTVRVYIRKGANQNSGVPKSEVFIADASGRIEESCAPVWDYDHVTSLKAYPIDAEPLVIRGGTFITLANRAESKYNYHARNFQIERSNVRVEGLTHLVSGEGDHGAPYNGFLNVDRAAEVLVEGCVLTGHKTYVTIGSAGVPVSMGSYDLTAGRSARLRVLHCRQTNDIDDSTWWGLFASNFCKEIYFEDCVFSRFDAHMGVKDITLKDCTFGYMGVQAVGFGTMTLERCEIHRHCMILLRPDYGSFWEGEVAIRHCRLVPPAGSRSVSLISGSNDGTHDFGYPCCLPSSVTVDGLEIDDVSLKDRPGYAGPAVFASFDRKPSPEGLLPLRAEGTIRLGGVRVVSGKELLISPNPGLVKDYGVIVE